MFMCKCKNSLKDCDRDDVKLGGSHDRAETKYFGNYYGKQNIIISILA